MTILEKRISYLENNSKVHAQSSDSEESFET